MTGSDGLRCLRTPPDLVFGLSIGAHEVAEGILPLIGHAASLCLARAIARAAYHATPAAGDLLPCWSDLNR